MQDVARAALARRSLVALLAALAAAAVVVAALVPGRGDAAPARASAQVAALEAKLAAAERDARFWRQLIAGFKPAKAIGLNSMSDHYVLRLPSDLTVALHFDNMNLAKAKNLNWVAVALPGRFTRADQARVNRLYGPGFTHFHSYRTDAHGGPAGTRGVWFVHVGARHFTSPFGRVRTGKADPTFMPTRPPR